MLAIVVPRMARSQRCPGAWTRPGLEQQPTEQASPFSPVALFLTLSSRQPSWTPLALSTCRPAPILSVLGCGTAGPPAASLPVLGPDCGIYRPRGASHTGCFLPDWLSQAPLWNAALTLPGPHSRGFRGPGRRAEGLRAMLSVGAAFCAQVPFWPAFWCIVTCPTSSGFTVRGEEGSPRIRDASPVSHPGRQHVRGPRITKLRSASRVSPLR